MSMLTEWIGGRRKTEMEGQRRRRRHGDGNEADSGEYGEGMGLKLWGSVTKLRLREMARAVNLWDAETAS